MKIPNFLVSDTIVASFKKLYRQDELEAKLQEYYSKKIKQAAGIIIIGVISFAALSVSNDYGNLETLDSLMRNDYLGGSKVLKLEWSFDKDFNSQNTESLDYEIKERKYSEEQLENIKEIFFEELCEVILSDNSSFEHVKKDLKFISGLKEFPFSVSYLSEKPLIISADGKINTSMLSEDGESVVISIDIKYEDFFEREYLPICIYPEEKSSQEILKDAVMEDIKSADEESKYDLKILLPESVYGEKIYFRETKKDNATYVLLLSIIFSCALFFIKDNEIKELVQKREKELDGDYAKMINKFVLFYNAGFSVNLSWQKLCNAYELSLESGGNRSYVYEEMLVSRLMINDGVNEMEAYENFGLRCGLAKYKLFSSLICQALVKGKSDIGDVLKNEADKAFTERKNNAKKLSEEAGTKLLIPMFMMLAIVMIMVILPAFSSFVG